MELLILQLFLLLWLACGVLAAHIAGTKECDGKAWLWVGFLLGPHGVIGAAGMPDRRLRRYMRAVALHQGVPQEMLGSVSADDEGESRNGMTKSITKSNGECVINRGDTDDQVWLSLLSALPQHLTVLADRQSSVISSGDIRINSASGSLIATAQTLREGNNFKVLKVTPVR